MGLGICFRSCPPIQATPESPPLLRYNRYPTPSLIELGRSARCCIYRLAGQAESELAINWNDKLEKN